MDGPRGARAEEFAHYIEQTNRVFRDGVDQSIGTDYPLVFSPQNLGNMRLIRDAGRIVSYVGLAPREVISGACRFPTGLISVMGTLPEYRHRGLATQLVEDALIKMAHDKLDFGLLWTDVPGFYRRTGWEVVGSNGWTFLITPDQAATFATGHTIREFRPDTDLDAIIALHETVPDRIGRSRTDSAALYSLPKLHIWVAEGQTGIEGYAADAHAYNKDGIVEWGGTSAAIESLIAHSAARAPKGRLQVSVPLWPNAMSRLLEEKGCRHRIPMEEGDGAGLKMVRIVRLRQLLEHMRPHIADRAADVSVEFGLTIRETGEHVSVVIESGRVTIGRRRTAADLEFSLPDAAALIFGPGPCTGCAPAPGPVAILDRIFPFPFHVWMLDYV